jgi:PAS domain S-box-containing protein
MQKVMFQTACGKRGTERAEELFRQHERTIHSQTDRLLAKLMMVQWLAGMAAALWLSPRTWIGAESTTHWHVWAAVLLGGAIAALPVGLALRYPGRVLTRHCMAVGQMLFSALFIHLTGGRIETHFHVFGSLAFLSFYRDWRVIATATTVVAADHALRGMFWPQSVFGVLGESNWRWLEHAGWVIFEDLFLVISIRQSLTEMREGALRRSNLEASERQAQRVAHVGNWELDLFRNSMIWSAEQFRLLGMAPENCSPSWELLLSCVHPEDRPAVIEWIRTVQATHESGRLNFRLLLPSNRVRVLHSRADVVLDETGRTVRVVGISQDITERQHAEDLIRASELKFRSVTQSVGEAIISADRRGHIILWNRAAETIFGYAEDEVLGRHLSLIMPERYRAECLEDSDGTATTGETNRLMMPVEWPGLRKNGSEFPMDLTLSWWTTKEGRFQTAVVRDITRQKEAAEALRKVNEELESRVAQRTAELTAANEELQAEVRERHEAEAKLEILHKQLLESSRRAGMAEVATSVLHNVGNVLNSVNISCSMISGTVRKSGLEYLVRTAATLVEQGDRAADYLANDPAGRKIPAFLTALTQRLQTEQNSVLTELETLGTKIDHIKEIVSMQQNYGRVSGVTEIVRPIDLLEDSLRMNAGALKRHEVAALREYAEVPAIKIEKHKVLQILVNVIRNAKYACDESGRGDKQITVRVSPHAGGVRIIIADNGVGIPAENLTRIFGLGFTTRKDGHGYGLHSAGLAAQELGGRLSAHSNGPGCGATFTLDLPIEPPIPTR